MKEMVMPRYADVIIEISHEKVDRPFQYRIPPELIQEVYPGVRVHVPFGRGNQDKLGYVVDLSGQAAYPPEKLKTITAVDSKGITVQGSQIQIAYWMKRQYGSTTIAALKTVLPVKQKLKQMEKKKVTRCIEGDALKEAADQCMNRHQTARARVLYALMADEVLPYELIRQKLNVSPSVLTALEKQGVLRIEAEAFYRNPVRCADGTEKRVALSAAQRTVIDGILADYRAGRPGTYLLHGVTGSGKTEVYLGMIEQMVAMGRQAIVLIPEIALTYQTLLRFYRRFGDRVSVINSSLSMGEKYDQIMRAQAGELDVIIGPRSALFTPFPNLGMIIIDEEHENSYKSESMPKYHARETAVQIASMHGASVVLGSATPSMEAYYRAKQGQYRLYEMTGRHGNSMLPRVYTVDLREELKQGNRSMFSRKLRELLEGRLQAGEQTMLFLNRRGYAGFISCRACGHVMKCPHCDVSLSEHRGNMLLCHYCGHEEPKSAVCPVCGSKYLLGFKAGTQQIEEAVEEKIFGGSVPKQYIPAVEKGLREAITEGVLAGYPVSNIKVTLTDGSYHDVDSSEMAFKIATNIAFRKACEQAKPVLMEPIMNVEIRVPDAYTGDIMGDINGARRGRIMGMEKDGKMQVINAQIPLAELSRYTIDLKSMTQGRGKFTMEPAGYEEAPANVAEKVIAKSKKD